MFDIENLKAYSKLPYTRQVKKHEQLKILRPQKLRTAVCGRGFGKSHLEGKLIKLMFSNLPRTLVGIASLTFGHILTVEIPEITYALANEGIVEGMHYVVGKRPPDHFWKPFRTPRRYEYCITFVNGFTLILLPL